MQKRKRVALHCRVSTELELQRNSLTAQMDFQKQEILENRDWEYVAIYTDTKSGRTIKYHPGFQKMLESLRSRGDRSDLYQIGE
jgi:DNA invertase Pin-like site-specific DNA recombinase